MKKIALVALAFLVVGCSTSLKKQQDKLSELVHSPLLIKVYSTDLYTVYYDKALKRCVMYAFIRSTSNQNAMNDSIGLNTFECQPEEVKKTADATPFVEDKTVLQNIF